MKTHSPRKSTHSNQAKNELFFSRNTNTKEPFFKPSYSNSQIIQMDIDESKEFTSNEKLMRIYSQVKNTEQFKTMVKGFNESGSHLDLELTTVEKLKRAKANTSIDKENHKVTIKFSEEFIQNSSDISIVKTIHHELQHAIKNLHLKRSNYKTSKEYPGIKDYYKRYVLDPKEKGEKERDWHHNLMAAHTRPEIIRGLKQFDTDEKGNKKDRSGKIYVAKLKKEIAYSDGEFYEALAWNGLTHEKTEEGEPRIKTEAWRSFEKENSEKAALFQAIGIQESTKFKILKGGELKSIEIIGEKE